jgi:hypothetical protein
MQLLKVEKGFRHSAVGKETPPMVCGRPSIPGDSAVCGLCTTATEGIPTCTGAYRVAIHADITTNDDSAAHRHRLLLPRLADHLQRSSRALTTLLLTMTQQLTATASCCPAWLITSKEVVEH